MLQSTLYSTSRILYGFTLLFMASMMSSSTSLAVVEVVVTKARETKEKHVFDLARSVGASSTELTKLRRKCAMVRLEMCKFVSDLGKAFYDCELSFAHEGVFIGCALFSALLSTHKNMVKVLK